MARFDGTAGRLGLYARLGGIEADLKRIEQSLVRIETLLGQRNAP